MNLGKTECRVVGQAVDLIFERKRVIEKLTRDSDDGMKSVLLSLKDIEHKNIDLTPYFRNQIINSITKPLAFIFFLSHTCDEKDVVEQLATYIENMTYKLSIWYEVASD